MKIFISSLIAGMESFRAAAREAARSLGLEPVMAEDFGARPQSPQVACLDGVRRADAVVLIMGKAYGATQASGLSATHEEYREAKERCPVFVFVQEGIDPEAAQKDFLNEVQAWGSGLFRAAFSTPEELRSAVTRALHQWMLTRATGPLEVSELTKRCIAQLPRSRGYQQQGAALMVSVAGGPVQSILRPVQIEDPAFAEELQQAALFGPTRIFTPSEGSAFSIREHKLVLEQTGRKPGSFALDESGGIVIVLPVEHDGSGIPVLLEDVIQERLAAALRYAVWLLDRIDRTERLSHAVVAASIAGGGYLAWRTRREHEAIPNSVTMSGFGQDERPPVHLTPPHRTRAALRLEQDRLVEDFVVLLRRQWR